MKIEEMELYIKDKCSLHPKMSLLMWKEEENKKIRIGINGNELVLFHVTFSVFVCLFLY